MKDYNLIQEWVLRETAELPLKDQQAANQILQVLMSILKSESNVGIRNPKDVYLSCLNMIHLEQEHFVVLFLNTKNRVKKRETIFIGGLDATIIRPREIFRAAIRNSSAGIICVHNHPSGDPTPSQEDIAFTQRLVDAGKLIGIKVIDHVVIGAYGYCSIAERGIS